MSYKRVISLLPSATEMLYVLSSESLLVGRSHECDYPSETENIPICTSSSIHNEMSSLEIDEQVKSNIWNALSLYTIDIELVKQLQPDLIITQDQCKVCAIHLEELADMLSRELGYEPAILSFHPHSLEDMYTDFMQLASAIDKVEYAVEVLENWKERIELIQHKIKFVKNRPNIVCIEWMEPLMTAGHWTPELITIAGGVPLLSEMGNDSQYINMDQLIEADPDGIIISACGFPLSRIKEEYPLLQANEKWNSLRAVQKGHVFLADGNSFFNRSGPRLVDTTEMIAEILQLNQFYYGMEGEYWEQISFKM